MHKTMLGVALAAATLCIAACSPFFPTQRTQGVPKTETLASAVIHPRQHDSGKSRRKQALIEQTGDVIASEEIGFYMDIQEARLRQQLSDADVELTRTGDTITLSLPGRISFETNSSRINANIAPLLDTISGVLTEFNKTQISVYGHTDNSGLSGHNQKLSERRGISVARYLLSQGVPIERLVVIGYGDTRPIARNNTDQGRERNRRVELALEPVSR